MGNIAIFLASVAFVLAISIKDIRYTKKNSDQHPELVIIKKHKVKTFVLKEALNIENLNIDSLMNSKKTKTQAIFIFQDRVSNFSYVDINSQKNLPEEIFLTTKRDTLCTDEIWNNEYVAFIVQKKDTGFDQTLIIIGKKDKSEKIRKVFEEILEKTKLGAL